MGGNPIKKYIINERIRAKEVRLIDHEGAQVGIVETDEARKLAEEKGLDLLLITQESNPPVCRIVNIGQYKYEQRKKEKLAKKSGKAQVLKELKMSPKISEHDYQVRINQTRNFLEKKYLVKMSVFFRGREMAHPELGKTLIEKYISDLSDIGAPSGGISRAPRALIVMINPK